MASDLFEKAKKSGYVRVIVDGNMYDLSEEIPMDKNIKHNIEIVVDRLIVKPGIEKRLSDSIETVLDLAEGLLMVPSSFILQPTMRSAWRRPMKKD